MGCWKSVFTTDNPFKPTKPKKVGMIDLDRKTQTKVFPNLPLMKLSAWHKQQGDDVSWYDGSHYDLVYVSKVFSFSPDYEGGDRCR